MAELLGGDTRISLEGCAGRFAPLASHWVRLALSSPRCLCVRSRLINTSVKGLFFRFLALASKVFLEISSSIDTKDVFFPADAHCITK